MILSSRLIPRKLKLVTIKIGQAIKIYSIRKQHDKSPENQEIPRNILQDKQTAHSQPEFGIPYDCKPFKMLLEKDKKYSWCSCGHSHKQPLCDGTHKFPQLQITLKPVRFAVDETKEYYLCNCKHTKNRPFCDGSHRESTIVDACKNKPICTG